MPADSPVVRWSAFEHEFIERGADWYWALGIVAVSIAVTALLLHDFLFSILILVAAATIALHSREAPDIARFELSDRGVRINGVLHRYDEIISFWVEEDHHSGRALLLIDTVKFMSPNLIIPIEEVDPGEVRAFLQERCDEVHMREPLTHRIFEALGL